MTAKRFTITQDFEEHHRQIRDNGHIIMGCFLEPQAEPIVNLLNELHEENKKLLRKNGAMEEEIECLSEENEQLKQAYSQLKHRHSLLHDVCIDAECDRDSYRKDIASLEKENEQLKNLNIPIDEIKDTVIDYQGRIIGVYYND